MSKGADLRTYVLVAITILATAPAWPAVGVAQAAVGCAARAELDSIDARAPEDVLGASGFVSGPSLRVSARLELAGPECAQRINHPPELLAGWVDSSFASPSSFFTYYVHYVDLDGDAPLLIEAALDGADPRPMEAADPADLDYTDGARFTASYGPEFESGLVLPVADPGDHYVLLQASDGLATAETRIDGPRLRDGASGALMSPNPSNRLFIHPIANGPTLTPPSEVLPPLSRLSNDAPNGVYSHTFAIDPLAAQLGAGWSVGEGGIFRLAGNGLLEQEPGPDTGLQLLGAARIDGMAHQGARSVDLAPPGTVAAPDGSTGGLRLSLETSLHFAQVGWIFLHHQTGDQGASLRVGLEMDLDHDGVTDRCAVSALAPTATGPEWVRLSLDRATPFSIRGPDCTTALPQPASGSLDELQDDPTHGLSRVLALRVDGGPASSATSAVPLRIDSLQLQRGFENVNADIDICFYGEAMDPTASPLQPLACVSDIGPHSGVLPAGATIANVWADQIIPTVSFETFLPGRPYLEPAAFSFNLQHRRAEGPALELPSPRTGHARLVYDADRDGSFGPDDPVLASIEGVHADLDGQTIELQADIAGPDADIDLRLLYDPAMDGIDPVPTPFTLARFTNDAPTGSLGFLRHSHPKHTVTFLAEADDPDLRQGDLAARLGGLRTWCLEFGDGTPDASGAWPAPSEIDHTYRRHGTYTARWTVSDAQGATSVSTQSLAIGGHPRFSEDVE